MGDLEPWMDEMYLQKLWLSLNVSVMVKVIRDKATFISSGYAFVDFESISAAQCALDMFNGEVIPSTSCTFKLNWASGGGIFDKREDRQPEYSLFLGDLSHECSERILLHIFRNRYPSCKSVKIMTYAQTGQSRGYGFVRFLQQLDQLQALDEMQGCIIGSRPIRVSLATPKNSRILTSTSSSSLLQRLPAENVNTTVFVGGLSCPLKEEELRQYFEIFGDIIYVKIPPGKGCGFVQFVSGQSAEMAIEQMNGYQIGSSRIRLSWGKSQQYIQQQNPTIEHYKKELSSQTHQQQPLNSFDKDPFDTSFTRMMKPSQAHTNSGTFWSLQLKKLGWANENKFWSFPN
ncbi:hypothetical protein HMPREF1544_11612 [Mucor circinelloides 1006PhL]|uniref:RRM domain-containing protein n=1 Tax=Mucor circinelloides f. circinelloides (strain 1006PhL) TaxID=1220926 RepID=S2J0L0_MUCC1|nr:hypothetical protein HMPREF1544_11612 [Mucor circinelloides 1006PhL]